MAVKTTGRPLMRYYSESCRLAFFRVVLVVGAGLPLPPGTKFKLHLDRIGQVTGTVAWADEELLGIRFEADPKFIREALGESAERFGLVGESDADEAAASGE